MSFSSDVKTELLSNISTINSRHCKMAELTAIINVCGFVSTDSYDEFVVIHNDNIDILNLTVQLIYDIFNIKTYYVNNEIVIRDNVLINSMINVLGIKDSNDFSINSAINPAIVAGSCCKRAYIRMAFVCCGSVNDPSKHYHLEFTDNDYDHSQNLVELISNFGIEMKVVERKNRFVIYCKEAEQIVDLLNVMSAYKALFEFENLRVVKEVRNNINRIVNCETANINKIVSTSVRQIEDIEYIMDKKSLNYLPDNLREVAEVRLKYPDASLKELGEHLTPKIGKSGVNHRLKKIHEIAENLKGDL
ncbi:MAG: DNA-binding protein WhiA [Clostridia bacterium]|nr:DNA-binding protein WhiA [Clostridia bacterium]